jgi:hypothetical protein
VTDYTPAHRGEYRQRTHVEPTPDLYGTSLVEAGDTVIRGRERMVGVIADDGTWTEVLSLVPGWLDRNGRWHTEPLPDPPRPGLLARILARTHIRDREDHP